MNDKNFWTFWRLSLLTCICMAIFVGIIWNQVGTVKEQKKTIANLEGVINTQTNTLETQKRDLAIMESQNEVRKNEQQDIINKQAEVDARDKEITKRQAELDAKLKLYGFK